MIEIDHDNLHFRSALSIIADVDCCVAREIGIEIWYCVIYPLSSARGSTTFVCLVAIVIAIFALG